MSSKNFSDRELACNCCQITKFRQSTVDKFQWMRDYLDRPIYMYSGGRCRSWNKKVNGSTNSSHIFSKDRESCAGDLSLIPERVKRNMTSNELFLLQEAAQKAGFSRIGIHRRFIHVDDNMDKPPNCMWLY